MYVSRDENVSKRIVEKTFLVGVCNEYVIRAEYYLHYIERLLIVRNIIENETRYK